jgi:pimeloyl-ACP methyl ester carboxylesterase
MEPLIDRAFVRIAEGLVHLRKVVGDPGQRPLCLIHLSPASSQQMEPLMGALRRSGFTAPILAPDTLGNGDSARPAPPAPDIAYFADSLARVLDALEVERVDVFGSHTGGRIGCEFAHLHPDRIGRLVIDGIIEYSQEQRDEFARRYTPPIAPDAFGTHLIWAFNYSRNQHLFYPWFEEDAAHRLARDVPSPQELHRSTMDILKSLDSYSLAYQAAFHYAADTKVPALECPTLLLKPKDAAAAINAAADRYANARNIEARDVAGVAGIAAAIQAFLQP